MTSTTTITRPDLRRDAAVAADAAPTDDVEVRIVRIGTFATGQSAAGDYVVATEAPVGSFACGHTTPGE